MTTKYTLNSQGVYHTRVWDGTFVNGKKHYKELTSKKSSKDLELKVRDYENKINQGQYTIKSDVMFSDYAHQWLDIYKADASMNTRKMYENIIDKHLLIDCQMRYLNRSCLTSAADPTKGQRTRQQIVLTLKQICKCALRDKLISQAAFDDIFKDTIKVKYKSPEKRPLRDYEKDALFRANLDNTERAFVTILYYCGLRRGEAIALTKNDITDKGIVVNKAVAFDVNNPILKDTKNEVHRIVPMPNEAKNVLKSYVDDLETDYLFTIKDKPITKSSLDKMWRRIINKMNEVSSEHIDDLTPHIFRHNYCATLCKQIPTISINRIAELLGDSKQMVIEVYNHSIESKEQVQDVLNNIF